MSQTKMCTKCQEEKELSEFHVRSGAPDGRRGVCKKCKNVVNRLYSNALKDLEKILPKNSLKICCTCKIEKSLDKYSIKSASKDGYMRRCKNCVAKHHQKTKGTSTITQKEYYENNKDEIRKYKLKWVTDKLKNDLLYKLKANIRSSIICSLKRKNLKKEDASISILKMDIAGFKQHIEKQFLPWMDWDNYGDSCGSILIRDCSFDIDHIIPTSYAKTKELMYLLNHWSNFQPLCSKINRDIKRAIVYPCTNLELRITFWEDYYEHL